LLTGVELRAARIGVGADRVLIAEGLIAEETYVTLLAASLGIPFQSLDATSRAACPIPDDKLIEAAVTGLLPLVCDNGIKIVVAPSLVESRFLLRSVRSGSGLIQNLRITSPTRLRRYIAVHGGGEIGRRAAESLRAEHPEWSAGTERHCLLGMSTAAALLTLCMLMAPGVTAAAIEIGLGAIFLAWSGLRLAGALSRRAIAVRPAPHSDDRLPVYSIVIALYREAVALGGLIAALRQINYPREKLDIKLVLEADDRETLHAIKAMRLAAPFEIIVAPNIGPRTKPKALNVAMPFVRGEFVAVYDAEDRPEPDQLRTAMQEFAAGEHRLACVQARLTIDNSADNWLTRLFAAEYATLFDVLLPGLANWRLPLPLGGSSNHFRTAVLRQVRGWDPYNVTEDADLGMRLARLGYRCSVIAASTYEEAPARLKPWLRQRTRWCKGWMQTWLVHMRTPGRLARELGPSGFAVFQLLVGGTVLAALVHTLFLVQLSWELAVRMYAGAVAETALVHYHLSILALGYFISAAVGVVGLARRKLLGCSWALLLIPVYWLLLSLAAWRALFQLVRDPYRWEKTEHGLARTSRLASRARQHDSRDGTMMAR
jgi:cellulose synthase/poly-beta-1,6-N-acetylglucosamine synthase-like glycosyltransferase